MPYDENLARVRGIARQLDRGLGEAEQTLKNTTGINQDALKQLIDSKRDFLKGILNTEPPPELRKLLEDSESNE